MPKGSLQKSLFPSFQLPSRSRQYAVVVTWALEGTANGKAASNEPRACWSISPSDTIHAKPSSSTHNQCTNQPPSDTIHAKPSSSDLNTQPVY